ncbi:MAG: hypothetical protein ABWY04_11240 [Arthrobacter sp.]
MFGPPSQDPNYQAQVLKRLDPPFTMLSEERLELAEALNLPTFSAPDHDPLYERLTLVLSEGSSEHVFYAIFAPNTHPQQVLDWLEANPVSR